MKKFKNNFIYKAGSKYIPLYLFVLVITVFSSGIVLLFPYSYAVIIQHIEDKNFTEIKSIVLFLFILLIGLLISDFVRYAIYTITNNKVIINIKNYFFDLMLKGNLTYTQKYTYTEILNRVENDINTTINILTESIFSLCTYLFSILMTVIVMLKISVKITLIILLTGAMLLLLSVLIGKFAYKQQQKLVNMIDKNTSFFVESLTGLIDIISFKMQEVRQKIYSEQNKGIAVKKVNISLAIIGSNKIIGVLISFTILLIYYYGAYLNIIKREIELGIIVSMVSYANLFLGDVISIVSLNIDTKILKVAFQRLDDLEKELIYKKRTIMKESKFRNLSLKNVSFKFSDECILKNINIDIKAGEKIAIIGRNGSGKSTLVKLLQGYFTNYSGSILFNEEELRDLDLCSYSQYFSCVGENPVLFEGTVLENLLLWDNKYSSNEVNDILQRYNIFFDPDFLQKNVGYLGENLSKGEKQKVALARALLKKCAILIFDEVDSHLDYQNYIILKKTLSELEGTTVICVTHDYSNLEIYNTVFIINEDQSIEKVKNIQEFKKGIKVEEKVKKGK